MIEYPKLLISGSYDAFQEGWNGCGVYMASGLYKSKTFKLPIYIGSAQDLEKRIITDHIRTLNLGTHEHNKPLQCSWNKHKNDGFIWWLLESTSIEEKYNREQYYLNLYRPFVDEFGGFNISYSAYSPTVKSTPERRLKQSERTKGENHHNFGNQYTDEHKQLLSDAHSHQDNSNLKKSYEFISPEGELVKINGLNEHCRKYNLSRPHMIAVNQGRRNHHKGWTSPNPDLHRKLKYKEHYLLNSNNEIIYIDNLRKYCKDNNLTYLLMLKFITGKSKYYLDWRIPSDEQITDFKAREAASPL